MRYHFPSETTATLAPYRREYSPWPGAAIEVTNLD
jgi:hypothetical protein